MSEFGRALPRRAKSRGRARCSGQREEQQLEGRCVRVLCPHHYVAPPPSPSPCCMQVSEQRVTSTKFSGDCTPFRPACRIRQLLFFSQHVRVRSSSVPIRRLGAAFVCVCVCVCVCVMRVSAARPHASLRCPKVVHIIWPVSSCAAGRGRQRRLGALRLRQQQGSGRGGTESVFLCVCFSSSSAGPLGSCFRARACLPSRTPRAAFLRSRSCPASGGLRASQRPWDP